MIRLGIVGSNFGRNVLLPAFRNDRRCEVVAMAGSDAQKTADAARQSGIPRAFETWSELAASDDIDAVAIATPPRVQQAIAIAAIENGKAVFLEKPLAADLAGARAMRSAAEARGRAAMVDFEFPQLETWRLAKALMRKRELGVLRHVTVTWNAETYATRMRLRTWKTSGLEGGGTLGNLVSHCFYYLEDFCGPLAGLSARLFDLPGEAEPAESTVSLAASFESGTALSLTVSSASYLGSGHRIEFYGEDGTLVLVNTSSDYMRGFALHFARRPAQALECIATEPKDAFTDGRVAPVSKLASRFLTAIETRSPCQPSIRDGYRVQELIEAARRSHAAGRWIDVTRSQFVAEATA